MSDRSAPRVAVVGAGPAGAFCTAQLLKRNDGPEVDLFERLPTPWGLLRAGVAPDHEEIKRLDDYFEKHVMAARCRFIGNVEIGTDVTHADLQAHYDAIVYAVGAQTDRGLDIPGEDLDNSLSATDFVGWYNGHPDRSDLEVDLSGTHAVVIGNGNVAIDVARMLTLDPDLLKSTDIADHALEALSASAIERVTVLGRRGPAQAAFTNAELRELATLDDIGVDVAPDEVELDPVSEQWLEQEGSFTARKNVELLREIAEDSGAGDGKRKICLRFLRSPSAIRGSGAVEAIETVRNEIERGDDGLLRARADEASSGTIKCSLVLRSVGYRAVPLPEVPFDERRYVLPTEGGRVLAGDGDEVLPGVYAVGWIKRGPTGILGTNKRDAAETSAALLADLDGGRLGAPAHPDRAAVDALLAERAPDHITTDGWRAIDALERERGKTASRPRVKLCTYEALTEATR